MSNPTITAKALRILANEIPAMCLRDAADLIERQAAEWATATIDAAIARAHRARLAAMLVSHTLQRCDECDGMCVRT